MQEPIHSKLKFGIKKIRGVSLGHPIGTKFLVVSFIKKETAKSTADRNKN